MKSRLLVPDKMTQQVQELATKPDVLSLIHRKRESVLAGYL